MRITLIYKIVGKPWESLQYTKVVAQMWELLQYIKSWHKNEKSNLQIVAYMWKLV